MKILAFLILIALPVDSLPYNNYWLVHLLTFFNQNIDPLTKQIDKKKLQHFEFYGETIARIIDISAPDQLDLETLNSASDFACEITQSYDQLLYVCWTEL